MLTGAAREELKKILHRSERKDLKIIELKMVRGEAQSKTRTEAIEFILSSAHQPSQVLRQQMLRKSLIRRYLWGHGIPVTMEQSKVDYIRICLDMWQVKDDDFLWKFWTDDEIDAEIDRFEQNMKDGLRELKLRLREGRPSEKELGEMKRSMDRALSVVNMVGRTSLNPSSDEGIRQSMSVSSSSEHDSDTSASSVEIVDISQGPRPTTHRDETSCSQETQSLNIESSSLDLSSSMDTCEPTIPHKVTSVKNSNTSPLQQTNSEDIFKPSSPSLIPAALTSRNKPSPMFTSSSSQETQSLDIEFPSVNLPSSMNTSGPKLRQTVTSVNYSNPGPSQETSSQDIFRPSSPSLIPATLTARNKPFPVFTPDHTARSPSSSDIFEPSSPNLITPTPDVNTETSPVLTTDHAARSPSFGNIFEPSSSRLTATAPAARNLSFQQHTPHRRSKSQSSASTPRTPSSRNFPRANTTETSADRNARQFIQTVVSDFFKSTGTPDTSYPVWKW